MSKILLHTCCGPCTTFPNKWLRENNFEVTGYFYNPNIFPTEEYERRLTTMKQYADAVGLEVIYEPNRARTEPGNCENCYRVRLEKCAYYAKENGFDHYSTTLLISPYQKHELLKQMGKEIGEKIGIEFFYRDFRTGFRESREMSKEMKLYRQKYCGCASPLSSASPAFGVASQNSFPLSIKDGEGCPERAERVEGRGEETG